MDKECNKKFLGKYIVYKTLGKGMFKVKLVYNQKTNTYFAAKISRTKAKKNSLEAEASFLKRITELGISGVIKFEEYLENSCQIKDSQDNQEQNRSYPFESAIIMELAPNDALFDYTFYTGPFNEKMARTYFNKIVKIVSNLHESGFAHRDLKLENILLNDKFDLIIADFGFAKEFIDKELMATRLGTEAYMAPEMYTLGSYVGPKIDIFALGVLLFLLVIGRPPFYKATVQDPFYKHFINRTEEKFWNIFEEKVNSRTQYSESFKELINHLLFNDSKGRLTIVEIKNLEWMKDEILSDAELYDEMIIRRKTMLEKKCKEKKVQHLYYFYYIFFSQEVILILLNQLP